VVGGVPDRDPRVASRDPVRALPCGRGRQRRLAGLLRDHRAIRPQHYAFLVGEEEFDAAFGRIEGHDLPYWADPGQTQPGVINHRDGGRGLYFEDPDGHLLEIITRPYGSGS
jgi:catechol 2,3-dioxygenase-like lactoylglutathione lyase family enzyme